MRLPTGSSQTWIVAYTGQYDNDVLNLILPYFSKGTVAVDVGASLGLYSVQLALKARDIGGKVLAFEPVQANRDVISENLSRNGLAEFVDLRPEALGAHTGVARLQVEQGGAGNAAIMDGVGSDELAWHAAAGKAESVTVADVCRLDDLGLPNRCSILKVDVEGYELEVLRGGIELVARDRPVILGEFSDAWLKSRGENLDWLRDWANNNKYSFTQITRGRTAWYRESAAVCHRIAGPIAGDMLMIPDELQSDEPAR